jgi:alpha-tubulin suppressor-like RCC1 family protein
MLALTADGLVASWGANASGQLGNGTNSPTASPSWAGVSGSIYGETIVAVAAAGETSLALTTDGRVYTWGLGTSGQLGNGASVSSTYPVLVGALLQGKMVVSLAGAGNTCYALTSDGQVFSWGFGTSGQLGSGAAASVNLPVLIGGALAGKRIVSLRAGANHILALGSDGQIYAWGSNSVGQLGNNSTTNALLPQAVLGLSAKTIVSIAAANNSSLALTSDGSLFAWGDNSSGQLGDNTAVNRWLPNPVVVPPAYAALKPNAVAMIGNAAFAWNSGAITIIGQPTAVAATLGKSIGLSVDIANPAGAPVSYQWKRQSGSGPNYTYTAIAGATGPSYSIPVFAAQHVGTYLVEIVSPLGTVISDTAALSSLTDPPLVPPTAPAPVVLAEGATLSLSVAVSGSEPFTYVWRKDGVPITGATSAGYTLPNAQASASGSYTLVVSNALGTAVSLPVSVTVGSGATNALGNVLVWGDNSSGQLGLPVWQTIPSQMVVAPSNVMFGKKPVSIGAGNSHAVVLADDGNLYAWGLNTGGQLGNTTAVSSSVPVAVKMSGALAGKTISRLSVGGDHSVVLTADGLVYSWGMNDRGQLGDGTLVNSTEPVALSTGTLLAGKTIAGVCAGGKFTLVATTDNMLFAWGHNSTGQLGNNSTTDSRVPVAVVMNGVLSGKVLKQISTGIDHVQVLTQDGLVYSWGSGASGQLGNGSSAQSLVPVAVTTTGALSGKVISSVTSGGSYALALTEQGEIFGWGAAGRRGDGSNSVATTPVAVSSFGSGDKVATDLVAGYNHAFIAAVDGMIYSFGSNSRGALGNGSLFDSLVATPILKFGSVAGKGIRHGTAGATFSMLVDADGGIHTWGQNDVGQLGSTPALTYLPNPTPLVSRALAGRKILQVATGGAHTVVLADDGFLYSSGGNANGQLGLGWTGALVQEFQQVPMVGLLAGKRIVAVGAGAGHTIVLTSDGRVFGWGSNSNGQLGNGTTTNSALPVALDRTGVLAGKTIVSIAAAVNDNWNLALTSDGQVFSWGSGASGRLGNNTTPTSQTVPVAVQTTGALAGVFIRAISAGAGHALALSSNGRVFSWGAGLAGRLGNGSSIDSPVPVAVTTTGVLSGRSIVAVAAGFSSSAALASDGRVFTWGNNSVGELGNSSLVDSNLPVAVNTAGALSGISVDAIGVSRVGGNSMFALGSNGKLYAWGTNTVAGALGDGTLVNKTVPTALAVSGTYASVAFNGIAASLGFDTSRPSFTLQPQPVTVKENDSFTLRVGVHAPGQKLLYQWKQETALNSGTFAAVSGGTSALLTVGTAVAASAGRYQVEVTSPAGTFVSDSALVTVQLKPILSVSPINPAVVQGSPASFTVTAGGATPVTFQWRRNGTNISGATSATYTIASAQTSNAASYDVVATNFVGSTTSAATTLTVNVPVTITTQPANISVNPSATATFSVAATGTAPLAYQWKKDGVDIAGGTAATLSVPSVQLSDEGAYSVVVSNVVGPVTSAAANLALNTPVSITTQPAALTVNPNASATFSVVATGTAPITYQWRKNNANIAGATSASYTIASAQASHAGDYNVIVSNIVGPVTSGTAALSVNTPVSITTQPQSLTVNPNASVLFSVTATGTGPLTYQWRKGGTPIAGATSDVFSIPSAQASDVGAYTVVVTNVVGAVTSSAATLSVNTPVTITTQPANLSVLPGGATSFTVAATGTAPLSYQWRKNGTVIAGATSASYSIASAQALHAGSYSVVVTNIVGSVTSNEANLFVAAPVTITTQPAGWTVNPNASVTFSVVATGTAPLTYQWRKGVAAIAGGTSDSYTIDSVQASDAGNYNVVITNIVGSVTSSNAPLSVNVPVTITTQPANLTRNPGTSATFTVAATGTAPLTYQWRKDGTPVAGGTSASFNLPAVAAGDAGEYDAVVTNVVGSVTSGTALLSVNTPVSITTQPVGFAVNPNSPATLSVVATGTAPLTYQWKKNGTNVSGATSPNYTIASAQPVHAGNYTVVVTNVVGSVTSGTAAVSVNTPVSITTQPASIAVNPSAPATFNVVASGTAPFTYQWRKGGNPISGGTSSSYIIDSAQISDAANYDVVVTNVVGSVTSGTALLSINTPAAIITQPAATLAVNPGAPATFTVAATGTAPLTYQWRKDGTPIAGGTSASYTITAAQPVHAGSYSVVVGNVAGSETSSATVLSINVPVSITAQPTGLAVNPNAPASFSVTAAGTEPFTYQWRRNGTPLAGGTASSYSIAAAQTANAGTYDVVVTNVVGPLASSPAVLFLNAPVSITTQPGTLAVNPGAPATFSVVATGTAPLSYQWYRAGTAIDGATSAPTPSRPCSPPMPTATTCRSPTSWAPWPPTLLNFRSTCR